MLLFVGFDLAGTRILADRKGNPLSFARSSQAMAVADLLDEMGLEAALVPAWPSWPALPDTVHHLGADDADGAVREAALALACVVNSAPGWVR
jgi:hypothetical protein